MGSAPGGLAGLEELAPSFGTPIAKATISFFFLPGGLEDGELVVGRVGPDCINLLVAIEVSMKDLGVGYKMV